jgi:hypothetical protein
MAPAGKLLNREQYRLQRLAQAQVAITKVLEARLVQQERQVAALSASRDELDAIASGSRTIDVAFLPSVLRNLFAMEKQLKEASYKMDEVRRQLLDAQSRQKAVAKRLRLAREAQERKEDEEDALEVAMAMCTKASGKPGVVS